MKVLLWAVFAALALGAVYGATQDSVGHAAKLWLVYGCGVPAAGVWLYLMIDALRTRRPAVVPTADVAEEKETARTSREAEVSARAEALAAAAGSATPDKTRIAGDEGRYIEVETQALPNGQTSITVTAYNFSGKQFDVRVRERLEKISGASWQKPINLGQGGKERKRQMKGTVTGLAGALTTIARIR